MTATATMYPDAIVVCGPIDLAEDQVRVPTLVVEVLSRSTEDHDGGAKWVAYRDLESLRHYLLVAQDARRVESTAERPRGGLCRSSSRGMRSPCPPSARG